MKSFGMTRENAQDEYEGRLENENHGGNQLTHVYLENVFQNGFCAYVLCSFSLLFVCLHCCCHGKIKFIYIQHQKTLFSQYSNENKATYIIIFAFPRISTCIIRLTA